MWVSSHVGLAGNSAADSAAKTSTYNEIKSLIKVFILFVKLLCSVFARQLLGEIWEIHLRVGTDSSGQ